MAMEETKKAGRGGRLWPLLLIGLGVLLLGNNLGWLGWSAWSTLARIWPAFLIAAGIDLLLPRRPAGYTVLALVLIAAIIGGALWLSGRPLESRAAATEALAVPLQGASSAEVVLERAAGRLQVSALRSADNLVEGRLGLREGEEALTESDLSGGRAYLRLRNEREDLGTALGDPGRYTWDIKVNDRIPTTLRVSVAAGESDLDLRELNLERLEISLAVGQNRVVLPEEGVYSAEISGAIGDIEVVAPKGLGARVEFGTALVRRSLPGKWDGGEDHFSTPGYDDAESRVDLKVSLAMGSVRVRRE